MTKTENIEFLDTIHRAESAIRSAVVLQLNIAKGNEGYRSEDVNTLINRAIDMLELARVMQSVDL